MSSRIMSPNNTIGRFVARIAAVMVLMMLASPGNATGARDSDALAKAFVAQDAKDWAGAKSLTAGQSPIMRDLVQWRYVSTSGSGATFDEINEFLSTHAAWPGRGTIAQRGEEALLTESLIETKGADWFRARPPRTSGGCLAYAKFQFAHDRKNLAHDRRNDALAVVRRCWLALLLNFSDYQDWASVSLLPLSADDHLARADALLWNRNWQGANELLSLLSPKALGAASARIKIQSGRAVDLDEAVKAAPSPSWGASLIFDLAVLLRKSGKTTESWPLLMRADETGALPSQYARVWWPEHNLAARTALDAPDYAAAYRLASGTQLSPGTNIALYLEAEFLSGWIALRKLDKANAALVHFQNLERAAKSPVSRARAAYWKAQVFRTLDDEAKAQQSLVIAAAEPATFYGRLALEMQREPRPGASPVTKPSAGAATEDIEELVLASETLSLAGDSRRANVFANAAIDVCQTAGCASALSARLAGKGNTYGALRSAKKAQTLGVTRLDQLYPLAELPASCSVAGVPPSLVLALARQESEFDPGAASTANARGLLQILPSTAQDVARRYKLPYAGADDLFQPKTNLSIGCYHLKDLLEAFGGSYVLTIAAYNAGRSRIQGWITLRGDPRDAKIDAVDWIETIPFDETRNYVMRVFENELAYKTRLDEPLQAQELNQDLRRKL